MGGAQGDEPVTAHLEGLTRAEVAQRVAQGLVNDVPEAPSRTIGQIVRGNVLTRFNALMTSLLAVVLISGAFRDSLFGGVIVANTLIGIVQELRAKRTLDRLSLLSAPRAHVIRDGGQAQIAINELVLDDVMALSSGQQIAADSEVVSSDELEVDESLLTGESDPVRKQPGEQLMSGSFVVAGSGRARVTKVGADSYAARLAEEARRFVLVSSELRGAINQIVRVVTWLLVPTGILLFLSQLLNADGIREGLVGAVGGVVAMVPEGLVLLTSVAMAAGGVRMAKRRTLVQELPAIEVLARVDVLCLDKTGTITTGSMHLARLEAPDGSPAGAEIEQALAALAWSDPSPNATAQAARDRFGDDPKWVRSGSVPFSSARKWSAAAFDVHGAWVFGAPEMVLADGPHAELLSRGGELAAEGFRVLVLAHAPVLAEGPVLPAGLAPAALVLFEDEIRPDAAETLRYFAEQGVVLKVISGDNPLTVGAVAARVGLVGADHPFDARSLPTDNDQLADVLESTSVFGRVTPHQKREMVKALQSRGHVVAMTGDGVNDVLALKDSDCGIAMASGSEATRSVAQLVLLDSSFSSLPHAVAEGRRVINNIERVASLFLVKTTYAFLLALATVVSRFPFPFLPRHLTLVGTFTIGVPAFFLALAPNDKRVQPGFERRVVRVAVPGGLVAATACFTVYAVARTDQALRLSQQRTAATIVLAAVALVALGNVSRPVRAWKLGLMFAMACFVALTMALAPLRNYFELSNPPTWIVAIMAAAIGGSVVAMPVAWRLGDVAISRVERWRRSRRPAPS